MGKILLDTDIGTDVDDAVCLAYLLAQPECELLGITTVTGEAEKRAMLASAVCRAADQPDIPIFPGCEQPFQGIQRQPVAQQAAALPGWPHETRFPQGQAIDFLWRTIRANPGEVTLLAVGPLTNLGRLFEADPAVAGLLKGLVLMGGRFFAPTGEDSFEWNVGADPAASEIVYRAPVRLHRSVGLDVTQRVVLSAEEVRRRFTAPWLRPVLAFAEIWFAGFFPAITFHDPLAVATVFDASLCTYDQGTVAVDRGERPGCARFTPGKTAAPHQVAATVDVERYFSHFFGVIDGYGR